jgi:hypothetical protein
MSVPSRSTAPLERVFSTSMACMCIKQPAGGSTLRDANPLIDTAEAQSTYVMPAAIFLYLVSSYPWKTRNQRVDPRQANFFRSKLDGTEPLGTSSRLA